MFNLHGVRDVLSILFYFYSFLHKYLTLAMFKNKITIYYCCLFCFLCNVTFATTTTDNYRNSFSIEQTMLLGDTIIMLDNLDTLVASCEGVLIDDGGINDNYANSTNASLTIEGTELNLYKISFDFFQTEAGFDFIQIYADTGNGFELYNAYSGSLTSLTLDIWAINLRFSWNTDSSVTNPGFSISWECISPSLPIADFELTSSFICIDNFELQDLSLGIPSTWTWYLDDEVVSTEQNPTIIVPAQGSYDVGLVVCNVAGCDTLIQPDLLMYDETDSSCSSILMVDGLNYTTDLCVGELLDEGGLNGGYSNNVLSIVELGGNGTQVYEISIAFFDVENNFDDLTLYVDNGNGFEFYAVYTGVIAPTVFEVQGQAIRFIWDTDSSITDAGFQILWECVEPSEPVANFSTEIDVSCSDFFTFQDDSEGFPSSWTWYLDDEIISTEQNPTIIVPAIGTYDVSLVVCNEVACDTLIQTDFITYNNEDSLCSIIPMQDNLDMTTSICEGTLTDDGGEDNDYTNNVEATVRIEVPNAVAYKITIDEFNLETGFDDLVIYQDNGNGYEIYETYTGIVDSITFLLKTPKIQFVFDTDGSVVQNGFVIHWECIGNQLPPQGSLSFDIEECTNTVAFNIESDNTDTVNWNFGDGTTAEGISIEHTFDEVGTYTVESVSTNQYGSTTNSTEVAVTYLPVYFEAPNEMLINVPQMIALDSHTENETNTIAWYLDGELLSNIYDLELELTTLGTYNLECVLTDTSGCISSHIETIEGVTTLASEEETFSSILIFPNPTNNVLHIQDLGSLKHLMSISLINALGKVVFNEQVSNPIDQYTLRTKDFAEGIYLLHIQTKNEQQVYEKIIITD